MRVHLYGNILNNGYNLTRFLRESGYDATLFLDESSSNAQDFPWWEDAHLHADNLPGWVRYYRLSPNWYLPGKREKRLIADFGDADVALVCGWGPILAGKAGLPFVFYSYGEDLNIADSRFGIAKICRMIVRGQSPRGLRKMLSIGLLQRRYLRGAEFIGIAMTYQKNHVRALGLTSKMVRLRLAWDIARYGVGSLDTFDGQYAGYDTVFFMIARHSWHSLARDLKGNDKFIRAFARFVAIKRPNVRLVLINKGHDAGRSRQLIRELGIESYVEWVPEMNKDGIRAYLSLPNVVVVDQFWHDEWHRVYRSDRKNPAVRAYIDDRPSRPSPMLKNQDLSLIGLGSASIEAMAAGRLLITSFFEHDFYNGEEPPLLNAFSEEEILDALLRLSAMPSEQREEMSHRAKDFVERFHSWKNVLPLYTVLIDRTHARHARERR